VAATPARLSCSARRSSSAVFFVLAVLFVNTHMLVAMPITSFALGTWQVYRLQWKKDLIEKYSNNLRQPAVILPKDVGDHSVEELDHRTVLVKGKFRHDQEMLVGPRTRDGVLGYHVITPIERENGYIALFTLFLACCVWIVVWIVVCGGGVLMVGRLCWSIGGGLQRFLVCGRRDLSQWIQGQP